MLPQRVTKIMFQIKTRIANVPGRQCSVPLGCLTSDVYVAAATMGPTLNFYSESADSTPFIRLNPGPASCITAVENSGKIERSRYCIPILW